VWDLPLVLAILANWVPDPAPDFGANPKPYVMMMVLGFVIGIAGHIFRFRPLVAIGVLLIFLGTFVFPLAINIAHNQ
jgi:hypothetical protein